MARGHGSSPTKPDQKMGGKTDHSKTTPKEGLDLPSEDFKENARWKQMSGELLDDLESLGVALEFVETTLHTKFRTTKVLIAEVQRNVAENATF
jgi:hypothetical protein